MHRAPRLLLALLLGTGVITVKPAVRLMASAETPSSPAGQNATLKAAAARSPDIPFNTYEVESEQQLLVLANQARHLSGAPRLTLDPGLSQAARLHAQAMLNARQLSHKFENELSLPERLAATTDLQLDEEAENVALDYGAQQGHDHLMSSPPHRANLLNPAYNVVGVGVVRSGDRLYIVQDFGRSLPAYTLTDLKDRIAVAVNQARHESNQPALSRRDLLIADDAACSMAHADRLGTSPVHKLAERFTVLTYTSLHPETLPNGAMHALSSANLRSFSIGACYSRTGTYPTGVYWMVLTLE
jgi:uncharacterized protein YkwD